MGIIQLWTVSHSGYGSFYHFRKITMNETYNKETVDAKLEVINVKLDDHYKILGELVAQVKKTNGKVRNHDKILIAVGVAVGTLLIVNGSPFIQFLSTLIK